MSPFPHRRNSGAWRSSAVVAALATLLATLGVHAQDHPPTSFMPIYVEDSPVAQDMVKNAERLRDQKRIAEAAAAYQQVIEQYPYKLMADNSGEPGLYIDTLRYVHRELLHDAELLESYRRLYEPTARGMLDAAAGDETALDDLEQIVARYGLCEAALEAALRAAALYLERADVQSAASVLDQMAAHPDLDAHREQWHLLQAATGLFGDQPQRLTRHEDALAQMPAADAQAQVHAWAESRRPVLRPELMSVWNQQAAATVTDPVGAPLWVERLPSADLISTSIRVQPRGRFRGMANSSGVYTALPMALGDHLIVNDGYSVVVLDRHSGRRVWAAPDVQPRQSGDMERFLAIQQPGRVSNDQRGVMVEGDRIVAVLGQATALPVNWPREAPGTTLTSLDRATGRVLWSVKPSDLDASLSTAFFHGTPLPGHGRAFVLLRRSQLASSQDAYVAAVDTATGKLIWKRYLSSTVSPNRYNVGNLTQMCAADGRLYLTDQLGTLACVDARTGAMLWLVVLQTHGIDPSPAARAARAAEVQNPVNPPVLVDAGLILPPTEALTSATLFDPDTGKKLRELGDGGWTSSRYFISTPRGVLAVGPTICLYDGKTLELKWQCELDTQMQAGSFGMAAVTRDHVIVPTKDRLILIKLTDGSIVWQNPLDVPGNVLALDQQVVIAGPQTVSSYMSWPRAYEELVRQMRRDPTDPRPGLALAHVALGSNKNQAVLEGVDAALAALQRRLADRAVTERQPAEPDRLQREVLEQLLTFVHPQRTPNTFLRRSILDRLATITATPADEVAYHMALAGLLVETGQFAEAVDHYQAVLINPALGAELYETQTGARQAGAEARIRLKAVIEQAGPKVYAKYEALAAQRLVELTQARAQDAQALIEVATQYPLSRSAGAALYLAAEQFAADGRVHEAISQLRMAYRQVSDATIAQRVVGRLVELYDQTGSPRRASKWLETAARDYPDIRPIRAGKPVAVADWLNELGQRKEPQRALPSLLTPLQHALMLDERLLVPTAQPRHTWTTDRILTASHGQLRLRVAPAMNVAWETPWEDPAELFSLTGEQAVLWVRHGDGSRSLVALDAQTGKHLWGPLDARELLDGVGDRARVLAARPVEQRRFLELMNFGPIHNPFDPHQPAETDDGYITAVNEQVVVLADALGRALALDRETGQVLWRLICPVDQLRKALINDDTLVLQGISGLRTDAQTDQFIVLDPLNGEPRFQAQEDKEQITWSALGATRFYYATASQLVAYQLAGNAQVAWRMTLDAERPTTQGAVNDESLLIQDNEGTLTIVDGSEGRVLGRIFGMTFSGRSLDAQHCEGRWHLTSARTAAAIDADGRELWRDGVSEPTRRLAQLVGDKYVVLLGMIQSGEPLNAQAMEEVLLRQLAQRGQVRANVRIRVAPGAGGPAIERWVEAADQPNLVPPLEPGDPAPAVKPGQWVYALYLLDRQGGSLIERQHLGPLDEPINPAQALHLDDRIVLPAGQSTIILSADPLSVD